MPAHPETLQGHVTTLDLLRELELRSQQEPPQQYLGTPRRQMLSGLPQYPSQGLENELFQKMSLRQALREVRNLPPPGSVISPCHVGHSSSPHSTREV